MRLSHIGRDNRTSDPRDREILTLARELREKEGDDAIEIDDDATVSEGDDNGAYVQAWVWVGFVGTALDKHKESE